MPVLWSILLVLLLVPGWSGEERLALLDRDTRLVARPLPIAAGTRLGGLALIGAVELTSATPGFGGFSAIALRRGRALLLSDGGNWVSFAITGGRLRDARSGFLPAGPGTGWEKRDRDSESLAIDPATGAMWVGFEGANAIWRYGPGADPGADRAEARARPAAMRRWPANGGAESLARRADGGFVAIAERGATAGSPRPALLFARDPTTGAVPRRFGFRPPAGYDPSDAVVLPGGDLLVLTRRWRFPVRFSAILVRIPAGSLRPGAIVEGRPVATLDGALGENWEGIAVTRERGATIVWLVSDRDQPLFQRTLLAKFRLD